MVIHAMAHQAAAPVTPGMSLAEARALARRIAQQARAQLVQAGAEPTDHRHWTYRAVPDAGGFAVIERRMPHTRGWALVAWADDIRREGDHFLDHEGRVIV